MSEQSTPCVHVQALMATLARQRLAIWEGCGGPLSIGCKRCQATFRVSLGWAETERADLEWVRA